MRRIVYTLLIAAIMAVLAFKHALVPALEHLSAQRPNATNVEAASQQ
ncbi:MAG: hypothetical protein ING66_09100 [Rhodocyclaceae bacterium]|jgi:Tfp pilus assembly protein PilO|nr:hypothetical protein [Rhodocyclaceae bacterium]MCA3018717.1 hypothetical protein [Rhodocyclaceae bacterium]MCA3025586.1 hypothetical protein [Rhodocyclaceae bacterium]MCA3028742.1 hypothetical protein [Rhodocyclaceae bacterium]MCA3032861.1 hypothetical protein [Rhodocyclaceae bacterium]